MEKGFSHLGYRDIGIIEKISNLGIQRFRNSRSLNPHTFYLGEHETVCLEKPKLVIARSPALAGRRGNLMGLLRSARNDTSVTMQTMMCS